MKAQIGDTKQVSLVTVQSNLQKILKDKAEALPRNFNQTRFIQNCMTVLLDIQGIEDIEPVSIARTMLKGAFLNLDFFNRECYAIPYNKNIGTKQNPQYVKEIQFQTDYKGEIKICKSFSLKPIKDIYAKVVRVGDEFGITILDNVPVINFKPIPFNKNTIQGAFAVCIYEDGTISYEEMSSDEIEHIRQTFSKQPNGLMWKETPSEAYKKTVIRRLKKWIPIDFNDEQIRAFNDGGDFEVGKVEEVKDPIPMPQKLQKAVQEDKPDSEPDTEKELTDQSPTLFEDN